MSRSKKPFHVTVHARPPGEWPRRIVSIDGANIPAWEIPSNRLGEPFPFSFEESLNALASLPRIFVEPDGAFVWVAERGEASAWQVDGMLYDRGGRLLYVELKGSCPAPAFAKLLHAFGLPPESIVVQSLRHAIVTDASEWCSEQ